MYEKSLPLNVVLWVNYNFLVKNHSAKKKKKRVYRNLDGGKLETEEKFGTFQNPPSLRHQGSILRWGMWEGKPEYGFKIQLSREITCDVSHHPGFLSFLPFVLNQYVLCLHMSE